MGLPFFILTPQHNPFKRGFFCNDESIRYPLKEDTISYQLLGGVMIPFTLIVVSTLLKVMFLSWCLLKNRLIIVNLMFADHLRRVPLRLHVSHQEPNFGDQICGVRLQSCGELLVRSQRQPVPDGRSQVLHRPSEAELPGCMQTCVGSHQLQSWWIHRELHLHRRQVSGGWGQVRGMKSNLCGPDILVHWTVQLVTASLGGTGLSKSVLSCSCRKDFLMWLKQNRWPGIHLR